MAREINLVPDVKDEMIRTLKFRNFIFFLCIVVVAASIGITVVVGLIAGGQQLAITGKESTIGKLSEKLNSYNDLNDFLTIKDQLNNINTLTNNKKLLSRTFNILSALRPDEGDSITISELTVNLADDEPKFSFDAQADALREPHIDYNVLDSFKKSMQYMRFDYGSYVDKFGKTIPAYCIIETGSNGAMFTNENKDLYAFWTIKADGCDPSATVDESGKTTPTISQYTTEEYAGQTVVKIWRTPQYKSWYKANYTGNDPYMDADGKISNVAHFESQCITYKGDTSQNSDNPKWESTNNCDLVPGGIEGIQIIDSANGRGASNNLVLRFSAIITLNPEVYKFTNTHMRAIPPEGRHNVTDSYSQVQNMFGKPAEACTADDETCENDTTNAGKDSNQSNTKDSNKSSDQTNTNGGNK